MRSVKYLLVLLTFVISAGMVQALVVQNYSFEDDGTTGNIVPQGWIVEEGGGGSADYGISDADASGTTDGLYNWYMESDARLYQLTDELIMTHGVTYTLTVDVYDDWHATPKVALVVPTSPTDPTLVEVASASADIGTESGMELVVTFTVDTEAQGGVTIEPEQIGLALGILLTDDTYPLTGGWPHFDNVRLTSNVIALVSPENGNNVVLPDADLEWTVGPNIEYVDVYFGTGEDPNQVLNDSTATSYSPTLAPETTYYWKVIAYEPNTLPGGVGYVGHDSGVWSFTTAPPTPLITAITPASQTVPLGSDPDITVTGVNIDYYAWYKDGAPLSDGADYSGTDTAMLVIHDMSLPDEGTYTCVVTNDATPDANDVASSSLAASRLVSWWKLDGDLSDSVQEVVPDAPEFDGPTVTTDSFVTGTGPDGSESTYAYFENNSTTYPGFVITGTEDFFNFYANGITINCWIKTPDLGIWEAYVSKRADGLADLLQFGQDTNSPFSDIHGTRYYSNPTVNNNEWHMVTMVYDGSFQTHYVDGEYAGQGGNITDVDASGNTASISIGTWDDGGTGGFTGNIDDVKIFNYPLTESDVQGEYLDIVGGYICDWATGGVEYDTNDDCVIDLMDFAEWVATWLNCNRIPETACP